MRAAILGSTIKKIGSEMPDQVRVLLTHENEDGTSALKEVLVSETEKNDANGDPMFRGALVWGTEGRMAHVGPSERDTEMVFVPWFPGPGEHRFSIFSHLPESWRKPETSVSHDSASSPDDSMPGLMETFDASRPGMHISDTIDYVYVISGEIYLELDDGEHHLKPGDVVVQRGTWHAWHNRTEEPCVLAAVQIGAERTG